MAGLPATPARGNADAPLHSSSATASTTGLNISPQASEVKNASLMEPSPASTYGGTAGTASVPATPQDFHVQGKLIASS